MAMEQDKPPKYDSYGFPISENKSGSNDWIKVLLWSLLVFFILFYTMTGLFAGYVAYTDNLGEPTYKLVLKVFGAFLFNWFYLGYKSVQKLLLTKL